MGIADYTKVYDLLKKAGNVEAQEQIMQLREEHLRQKEELLTLREENAALRSRLELAATMKFEDPYYWQVLPDGKDGPFCQVCYDKNGKRIRLISGSRQGSWSCGVCKEYIHDKSFVQPPSPDGATIARLFKG